MECQSCEGSTRLTLPLSAQLTLRDDSCSCSAEDVCDSILRSGARLNLPVLPALEHIAGQKWELAQLPGKAAPWVDEMCMHAQIFRERLSHVKGLSHDNVQQVGHVATSNTLGFIKSPLQVSHKVQQGPPCRQLAAAATC